MNCPRVTEQWFAPGWDDWAASQKAQPRAYERTGIRLAGATSPRHDEEHERV